MPTLAQDGGCVCVFRVAVVVLLFKKEKRGLLEIEGLPSSNLKMEPGDQMEDTLDAEIGAPRQLSL